MKPARQIMFTLPLAIAIGQRLSQITAKSGRVFVLSHAGVVTLTGTGLTEGILPDHDDFETVDEAKILALVKAGGLATISRDKMARQIAPSRVTRFTQTEHVNIALTSGNTICYKHTGARTLHNQSLLKGIRPDFQDVEYFTEGGTAYQWNGTEWREFAPTKALTP